MAPQRQGITAADIAQLVGGELLGEATALVRGIAPLDRAGGGDCSLMVSRRFVDEYAETEATVVLVDRRFSHFPSRCHARVLVDDAVAAFGRVVGKLERRSTADWGIHPSAHVGTGVHWTGRISIAAGAVVGERVRLGEGCIVETNAIIGEHARLGDGCRIEAHAVVRPHVEMGSRVIVRTGAQVGGDGFAFTAVSGGLPTRQPHGGGCTIGDEVEIGSNATVHRGRVGDTVLGDGTKLDALVHIGHNVRVGRACLIMAQVGVAGSSHLGDQVQIGGQAGITDHITVGDRARVAAQAGVIGHVPADQTVSGYPARNHRQVLRQAAALRRLEPLVTGIEHLVNGDAD